MALSSEPLTHFQQIENGHRVDLARQAIPFQTHPCRRKPNAPNDPRFVALATDVFNAVEIHSLVHGHQKVSDRLNGKFSFYTRWLKCLIPSEAATMAATCHHLTHRPVSAHNSGLQRTIAVWGPIGPDQTRDSSPISLNSSFVMENYNAQQRWFQ